MSEKSLSNKKERGFLFFIYAGGIFFEAAFMCEGYTPGMEFV